jgi:hypothetical protein
MRQHYSGEPTFQSLIPCVRDGMRDKSETIKSSNRQIIKSSNLSNPPEAEERRFGTNRQIVKSSNFANPP